MDGALTFDQLPQAVTMLANEVSKLKNLLIEGRDQTPINQPDQLLTVQQTAEFLNLAVPTIYGKVSKGEIPYMKKGKRLYFSRIELMDYIKGGRQKTNAEIEQEVHATISNSKGLSNGK